MCSHLRIASNRNERMRNHLCPKKTGSIVEATVLNEEAWRCVAMTLEAPDLLLDRCHIDAAPGQDVESVSAASAPLASK